MNFEVLVRSGFSIPEAVMLSFLKGAEYLEKDQLTGSVGTREVADLIVINGLFSQDATAIRQLTTAIKDGIGYDSQALFASVKGQVRLY